MIPLDEDFLLRVNGQIGVSPLHYGIQIQVRIRRQQSPDLLVQLIDEVVQLLHLGFHPRLHEPFNGGNEKMHGRFLTASHAGPVAARHGLVVPLLQKKGGEDSDAMLEIGDVDVAIVRVR